MIKKTILLLCLAALILPANGCGGKKTAEPVDPAAAIEARFKAAEKMSEPVAQAEEYLAIAGEMQKSAQLPAAQKPLKLAGEAIGKITSPAAKGRLAAELAILYARSKQSAESQAALAQAQGTFARIKDDPLAKTLLQTRIAVAQHELGSKQTAQTTLHEASTIASVQSDNQDRTKAWLGIALAAKSLNDTKQMDEAFVNALLAARTADSPKTHSELLIEIASVQNEMELKPLAEQSLTTALATAEQIEDPLARGYVLLQAVETRIKWRQPDQAAALFEQLDKSLASIPDKDQVKQLQTKIKEQRAKLAKIKK